MIMDELISGDVTSWVDSIRESDGEADLSRLNWEALVVAKGLDLERIRVSDAEILANIVQSRIGRSRFLSISTDSHFWGAQNSWRSCVFSQSSLKNVISPSNVFEECVFENCTIVGYRGFETLFQECEFKNCVVQNFTALPRPSNWKVAELETLGASVQFHECKFEKTRFSGCRFNDVAFRNCVMAEIVTEHCSFDGVDVDVKWWDNAEEADLFLVFLDDAIAMIRRQLGDDAKSANQLTEYRAKYASGASKDRDYSACLYDGGVPDVELDEVEVMLDELERQHNL